MPHINQFSSFQYAGHEPPVYRGLAARTPGVRVGSLIVSSLSVQESRQLTADALLEGSWHLRTLLQSEAMPSRVKSLAGVEAVLWTHQALPTLARRDAPVRRQERVRPPRKGTLPWERQERMTRWSWCSIDTSSP